MALTNEQERKIQQGKSVIAEQNLETLEDFLTYFQKRSEQNAALESEIDSVRSALPKCVWTVLAREPWKYWKAIYGRDFEGPNPNNH